MSFSSFHARSLAAGAGAALVAAIGMAGPAAADDKVIQVPDDFIAEASDTRSAGNYEVVENGLRVWTQGSTSEDKVAEYVAVAAPLAAVGDPELELTNNGADGATPPGYQLIVDFDGDGTPDGLLVGEPAYYGDDWWLARDSAQPVKDGAPHTGGGSGSEWYGTLDEWSAAFPDADVQAFGFSLGSGVLGDWTINAITFAGDRYTFAAAQEEVVLTSKDECKNGGWERSTQPEYENQGECVSSFAKKK